MTEAIVWIILLVAAAIASFIVGKKAELGDFCKELGEGFLAINEFLDLPDDATQEQKIKAAEKLRKEWMDVVKAGGKLFKKIIAMAGQRK